MATKKPTTKSRPEKAGKEQNHGNEVCKIHGDVKICGNPTDVEEVWALLELKKIKQSVGTLIDTAVPQGNWKDSTDDRVTPSELSEEVESADIGSFDDDGENVCSCNRMPEPGRKRQRTEV